MFITKQSTVFRNIVTGEIIITTDFLYNTEIGKSIEIIDKDLKRQDLLIKVIFNDSIFSDKNCIVRVIDVTFSAGIR
jgi:hypothetical protein